MMVEHSVSANDVIVACMELSVNVAMPDRQQGAVDSSLNTYLDGI